MKYLCNVWIDFMDGTHGDAGQTVDIDPAKVTDLADLEATIFEGKPAIERAPDDPAPVGKASKVAKPIDTPAEPSAPATEVTTNG